MTVGEKIKLYRKKNGITQKRLAEMASLNEVTIRGYEAEKYKPKIENLQKIANALDVSISALAPINRGSAKDESPLAKIRIIADYYRYTKQSHQCIEECSELIKAICKWHRRYDGSFKDESSDCLERTEIIGELADVMIMAQQLTYLLSAEDEVRMQIDFKLDRQLARMEEEEGC